MAWLRGCMAAIMAGGLLAGCQGGDPIPPITATATLSGDGGDVPLVLTLTHQAGGAGQRAARVLRGTLRGFNNITLSVSPPGLSQDSYYLLMISRERGAQDDLTRGAFTFSGDVGFMKSLVGEIQVSAIEAPTTTTPARLSFGPPSSDRSEVTADFVRVGPGAFALPWNQTDPACVNVFTRDTPPKAFDCLSLRTLMRTMQASLDGVLLDRFRGTVTSGDLTIMGDIPVSEIVGIVPNFIPANDSPQRRLRGFIVIFKQTFRINVINTGSLGGSQVFKAFAYLPVAMVFESTANGVKVTGDPYDTASAQEMKAHIAVVIDPGGRSKIVAQRIGDKLLADLNGIYGAGIGDGRWSPDGVSAALSRVHPYGLPADFEVVLLPNAARSSNRDARSTAIDILDVTKGYDLVFLQ